MTNPGKAPDNGDIDIDAVMQEIREEVARKRREGMFLPTENWPEPMHTCREHAGVIDDGAIRSALSLAEGNADAGLHIPPMVRFRGIVKKVATLTAKIVVYLSSFITERQRAFNQASVTAARLTTDAVNILDAELTRVHIIDVEPVFETMEESYVRRAVARSSVTPERLAAGREKDVSYYLFENIFYDPEVVSKKQEMYLKYVNRSLSHAYCHLDIGCGRGEFLDILSRERIRCKGVDVNELEVSLLREQGFDVTCSDALAFLRAATETFSGISALQFIEHVDVAYATEFINRAFQALPVDGVLVIETVNPHSPYAMANFFQDMTHLKPYPPEMMQFLLEWHGFEDVTVVYSSPVPKWARVLTDQRDGRAMKTYYQDYAVIGYKRLATRPPLSEIR